MRAVLHLQLVRARAGRCSDAPWPDAVRVHRISCHQLRNVLRNGATAQGLHSGYSALSVDEQLGHAAQGVDAGLASGEPRGRTDTPRRNLGCGLRPRPLRIVGLKDQPRSHRICVLLQYLEISTFIRTVHSVAVKKDLP